MRTTERKPDWFIPSHSGRFYTSDRKYPIIKWGIDRWWYINDRCENDWFSNRDIVKFGYNDPQPEERKIVGYRHKGTGDEWLITKDNPPDVGWTVLKHSDKGSYGIPEKYLETDYEPIYEPIKPKEIILHLGDKKRQFTIKGDCVIHAMGYGTTGIESIRRLFEMPKIFFMDNGDNLKVESIKIGCETYTRQDYQQIIDAYNQLNSPQK